MIRQPPAGWQTFGADLRCSTGPEAGI